MNTPPPNEGNFSNASREEIMAALFANMVIQQTNMAMMFLGKTPHPETGQVILDLEAAKMFIDQLQMLEAKTKGNLSKQEDNLLKQALAALHMAFVEAVEGEGKAAPAPADSAKIAEPPAASQPQTTPAPASATEAPPAAAAEESRKKFSKKY
jgi:hypothetical protein